MAQSYINDRTMDYESLKSRLMGGGLNRQRSDHFDVLNRHLRPGLVAPGQLVIISRCRQRELFRRGGLVDAAC